MMDVLKESADKMALSLSEQFDEVLRTAISKKLGGADWNLESLRGRLERLVFEGDERELFCLDGVRILELHPVRLETVRDCDSVRLIATRNYRLIGGCDEINGDGA